VVAGSGTPATRTEAHLSYGDTGDHQYIVVGRGHIPSDREIATAGDYTGISAA